MIFFKNKDMVWVFYVPSSTLDTDNSYSDASEKIMPLFASNERK